MWLNVVVSGDLLKLSTLSILLSNYSKLTAGCDQSRLLSLRLVHLWGVPALWRPGETSGAWGGRGMGREREAVLFSPLVLSVRLGHDLRSHLDLWSFSFTKAASSLIPDAWVFKFLKRQTMTNSRNLGSWSQGGPGLFLLTMFSRWFWEGQRGETLLCGLLLYSRAMKNQAVSNFWRILKGFFKPWTGLCSLFPVSCWVSV